MIKYDRMESKKLVELLEHYRLENRISIVKLSEIMKIPYISLYRWLNGIKIPNKVNTYHIKKFLEQKNIGGQK